MNPDSTVKSGSTGSLKGANVQAMLTIEPDLDLATAASRLQRSWFIGLRPCVTRPVALGQCGCRGAMIPESLPRKRY
jgi:hypothetical protein